MKNLESWLIPHFQGLYSILEAIISLVWQQPDWQFVFPGSSSALKRLYLYSSLLLRVFRAILSLRVLLLKSYNFEWFSLLLLNVENTASFKLASFRKAVILVIDLLVFSLLLSWRPTSGDDTLLELRSINRRLSLLFVLLCRLFWWCMEEGGGYCV